MKTSLIILMTFLMAMGAYSQTVDADAAISYCHRQVERSLRELSPIDYTMTPRNIGPEERHWNLRSVKTPEEWCAGFFPGILWMCGKDDEAAKYTAELEYLAHSPIFDHDLGFIMIGSYLKGYERTGNEHYREILLEAADTLATLFNPRVGTLLSWPRNVKMYGGHNTIIDNMINLELLLFSGKKENIDIAISHADTTMRYHFRPDATVNHVAVYDSVSGKHLYNCTHQGLGDSTLWSRGQAWAIYGYTMMYRYTRLQRYLDFACRTADVMLRQLPKDGVPWWDMDDPKIPAAYRDASAAAVIASGLVELSTFLSPPLSDHYLSTAKRILSSLSSPAYQSRESKPSFLLHSVGNMPAESEVDASINYADYYYIEALLRLKQLESEDKSKSAQLDYKMAGPYAIVARDGQYRSTKSGSERDMKTAHELARLYMQDGSGSSKARDKARGKALEIINAYSKTLQGFDGHDAPLCAIQSYDLVRAMTFLKEYRQPEWDAMVRRAMLPMIDKFEADSPYANGNWGAIVNRLRMACGIFLQDSVLYQASIDYFFHANDNGSLPNYISETGQCQETGRDQAHAQLGLEAIAQQCEMAWQQGDDLWGALDNRVLKGFEYTARYNLGFDVPFKTWTDCTGLYNDWTEPGEMSRGKLWDIYQLPYDHYVGRKGLQMPYTKMAIEVLAGKRKNKTKEYAKLHQVYTHDAPEGAPLKHDYDVFILPRNAKEWQRIDTYMARVNAPVGDGKHRVSEISYAFFDFTGDVFVKVVCKNKKYKTVKVRPDYKGVIAEVKNDSTVQFLLFQPENVSVEFDGNITDNLLLFTAKPSADRDTAAKEAKKQKRRFVYIEPGFYGKDKLRQLQSLMPHERSVADTLPDASATGVVQIPSHTTVYLAAGSYIEGTLAIEDKTDVSILGRGICRPSDGYEGAHVHRSTNVLIEGVTLCTCPVGGSDGVTLRNVHSISHPGWGDGLNVFASSNVLYDRVFCRNSDDCTTAYATRKGFSGSVRNIRMTNSTLWADVAHPIFIGIHGDSERMDSIVGLRYDNIDILCQSEPQLDYQGCLAINCGDNNFIKDVVFDNIRIENIHQGSILQVKVGYNSKYCTAPGRGIENVLFRNIRYYGYGGQEGIDHHLPNMSLILGYDSLRTVRNIRFEGLKINGRAIHDKMAGKPGWYKTADMGNIFVNDHVKNISFEK